MLLGFAPIADAAGGIPVLNQLPVIQVSDKLNGSTTQDTSAIGNAADAQNDEDGYVNEPDPYADEQQIEEDNAGSDAVVNQEIVESSQGGVPADTEDQSVADEQNGVNSAANANRNAVSDPPPGTEASQLEPGSSSPEVSVPGTHFSASASAVSGNTVTVKTLAAGTKWATSMYVIKSGVAGPVFMVIGGTHGNEVSGYLAARQVKNFRVKKGTLIVIPEANRLADLAGTRTTPTIYDLNRSFPSTSSGTPDDVLARSMWKAIKDYKVQWLLDLHEGYYFHKETPSSAGQSLIYYPVSGSFSVGTSVIKSLNTSITTSSHKFTMYPAPLPRTIARATGQFLGVHSFILETCRKESVTTRTNRHLTGVKAFLTRLGMV